MVFEVTVVPIAHLRPIEKNKLCALKMVVGCTPIAPRARLMCAISSIAIGRLISPTDEVRRWSGEDY